MKTTYKLQLKVISPLFIGSGDVYNRTDYIRNPKEKKVYLLNKRKWIQFLDRFKLYDNFMKQIIENSSNLDIYEWLKKLEIKKDKLFDEISLMADNIFDISHLEQFKNHEIHSFIKNANNEPYIPGSSIKGAIVTAVLSSILKNEQQNQKKFGNWKDDIKKIKNNEEAIKINDEIMKNLLNYEINDEIIQNLLEYKIKDVNNQAIIRGMSGLSISDSEPIKKEYLKLYKKKDIIIKDGKIRTKKENGQPVYREYIDVGAVTTFTITIDRNKLKKDIGINDLNSLLKVLSSRIKLLYDKDGTIRAWEESSAYLPENVFDSGIIQIGGGAGFHSKTIISSLSSNNKDANQITKNILNINFSKNRHTQDNPISPRALKVVRVKDKDLFIGFCQIKEIN